ncbi:hypothetical protein EON64_05110, partial [archaeon]
MDVTESEGEKLSVIIAGYKDDVVEKFFACNQGLPSRFTHVVDFVDFDVDQLLEIFVSMVEEKGWKLEPSIRGHTVDIATIVTRRLARGSGKRGFGNARAVRNLLDAALKTANERIYMEHLNGKKHNDDERITLNRDYV